MKKIAIVITSPPHGTAKGREALDAALSLSDLNKVSLFFIGDGIYHLLPNQQPDKILARDYIVTFGVLELYDIEQCYICENDMINLPEGNRVIPVITLDQNTFSLKLHQSDHILTF